MTEELFEAMAKSIIEGNRERAAELASESISSGIEPLDAINKGFVVGVKHVGEEFSAGNAFIPELVISGAAMKSAMQVLEPEIAKRGTKQESLGVVVLGTIEGDIHDIGKNLVGTMLSAYGFEVYDMGVDVPAKRMIEKAREVNADILAVSALLTTTMMQQKKVVDLLLAEGIRDNFKVLVGGAPVDSDWVEEIGADGYGEDAIRAVETAKVLLEIDQ